MNDETKSAKITGKLTINVDNSVYVYDVVVYCDDNSGPLDQPERRRQYKREERRHHDIIHTPSYSLTHTDTLADFVNLLYNLRFHHCQAPYFGHFFIFIHSPHFSQHDSKSWCFLLRAHQMVVTGAPD